MSSLALPRAVRRPAGDLPPAARAFLVTGAVLVTLAILLALSRALSGAAPGGGALKEVALVIHLLAVVPALPLGAWVLFARKGRARHRLLGRIWLVLMLAGALSALWIRHLDNGRLSWIHLLVPVVLVTAWRAIAKARRGDIAAHKRVLVSMFVGALIVPGLMAFIPGRLMWLWLVGQSV